MFPQIPASKTRRSIDRARARRARARLEKEGAPGILENTREGMRRNPPGGRQRDGKVRNKRAPYPYVPRRRQHN